jgi:hypothetical protein
MAATTPPDTDSETEPEFDGVPDEDERDRDENEIETICGSEDTTTGEPCERETENGDPCFMHGEDGPPENHGAPEDNDNGEDNAGGGPAEGNDNALKHGFHTATARRLDMFDDDQLAVFGDYYYEFVPKVENESAAARLATLAVIADELEADIIQNGVFRDVLNVGDGTGSEERTAGRSPKTETLNVLLRVLRELRIGKDAEGVSGNDFTDKTRAKTHFSNRLENTHGDTDELPWREGTPGLVRMNPDELGQQPERPSPPLGPDLGSPPDDLF